VSPPDLKTTPALRAWQMRALAAMDRWERGSSLLSAAPGAGKTRPALEFARRQLACRAAGSMLVACPTGPLTRQWARAASRLGVQLAVDSASPRPPRGFDGVAVTYARIAKAPGRWERGATARTLVIADEAHHLGEELAWGEAFAKAFGGCERWLLLSGTPFRSDPTPIPGVRYARDGVAQPDMSYTCTDAVVDGICRPVCFVAYDGTLSWRSGDEVIESSFETVLSGREASRRYRTAISTELRDGLPRILREADGKLRTQRSGGHTDAGGLVIAADSTHARRIAALLRQVTGQRALVVLHTEARAAEKLAAFTNTRDPWIVAVNTVSEGVDIPRLRVGVCTRQRPRRHSCSGRSSAASCARSHTGQRSRAGSTSPQTQPCATTQQPPSRSSATRCEEPRMSTPAGSTRFRRSGPNAVRRRRSSR
jgi:superfamily II DNA or RNA helicase